MYQRTSATRKVVLLNNRDFQSSFGEASRCSNTSYPSTHYDDAGLFDASHLVILFESACGKNWTTGRMRQAN